MNKALKYSATLIAIYLAVAYASGTGTFLREGSYGAATVVNAFQGKTFKRPKK